MKPEQAVPNPVRPVVVFYLALSQIRSPPPPSTTVTARGRRRSLYSPATRHADPSEGWLPNWRLSSRFAPLGQ
nr:unnamed protein product [Digitaria exilis]